MQASIIDWIGANLPLFLLLAGAGLTIAEAFAPGAHFIVLGVALLVAGLVGLLLPPSMAALAPVILAALVLGSGALTFYVYRQFDFYGGKGTDQTSDSDSLRGSTGRVTKRVTRSEGEVKLGEGGFNPYYQARSVDGDIEEGAEVMVMDPGGGNIVKVAPVDGYDEIERELERGRTDAAEDTDQAVADTDRAADADPAADGGDGDGPDENPGDREFEPDTA